MVSVLIILDGAAECGPDTSLQLASIPVLDRLASEGAVEARRTIPAGMRAGSEVGIPTLLGLSVTAPLSRGLIEAASAGIEVLAGTTPRRVDAPRDADPMSAMALARAHGLVHVRGHRFIAPSDEVVAPEGWRVWPDGAAPTGKLDATIIGGPGVAMGIGRLIGARTVVPDGCTSDTDTDLVAKAGAARDAMDRDKRVVVHVAAPDEASHRRDRIGKIASLETIDRDLVGPIADSLSSDDLLEIGIDHGTDPTSGEHLADPVPFLRWGGSVQADGATRFVEIDALVGVGS